MIGSPPIDFVPPNGSPPIDFVPANQLVTLSYLEIMNNTFRTTKCLCM